MKQSSNILIDEIMPGLTMVYYGDGSHKVIRGAITLEDFENRQREDEWCKRQLEANKI